MAFREMEFDDTWKSITGLPTGVTAKKKDQLVAVSFYNVAAGASIGSLPRPNMSYLLIPLMNGNTLNGYAQFTSGTWTVSGGGYGYGVYAIDA